MIDLFAPPALPMLVPVPGWLAVEYAKRWHRKGPIRRSAFMLARVHGWSE